MTTLNKGDRVTYSGELEVTYVPSESSSTVTVRVNGGRTNFPVWRSDLTKVKPALPTSFGSVVVVGGVRYLLDSSGYWNTAWQSSVTPKAMAEMDFTILRDGI